MDFKKLLNQLDSMEAPVATPAAPTLPQAVQLNEDAQLRVLSGRSTYVAEAKKKAEEKEEDVKEEMKVGDKKNIATGTVEKTKTGIVHKSNKAYGGSEEKADDKDDEPKSKKTKTKESIDPAAFSEKFTKMVEAKKKGGKPDFLDMDKDGDKKEPMKKAVADKKKNPFAKKEESVKEGMKVGDKKKSSTGGTIEKTKTGVKHTAGKNYSGKAAEADKKKTDESAMMPKGKKRPVKESVEQKLTFKQMVQLVQESGGQQQIDAIDTELFNWAQRVAVNKLGEGMKAELYAGLIYERNGGVFEMYDVLSEAQK